MPSPSTNPEPAPTPQDIPNPPECIPPPIRNIQPTMMQYTDGEGVVKDIWMPLGTFETACKHITNKDWDALARFPTWNNQKYPAEGEEEEKERETWKWLADDKPEPEKAA